MKEFLLLLLLAIIASPIIEYPRIDARSTKELTVLNKDEQAR